MSRTYEQLEPVISALDERIKTNLGAFPTDTAEGSVASFADGADDVPLKSLVVNIDPVQDLHGQDAPYPAGGGKNLLDPSLLKDQAAWNIIPVYAPTGTVLTMSTNQPTSETSGLLTYFMTPGGTQGSTENVYAGHPVTKTVGEEGYLEVAQRNRDSIKSYADYEYQIEVGSTATAYAPYENICPISGWTGMTVNATGKNLLNPNFSAYQIARNYSYMNGVVPEGQTARFTFIDKDTSVDVSGMSIGFQNGLDLNHESPTVFNWVMRNNGEIQNNVTNVKDGVTCSGVFIYPKTEAAFNALFSRWDIMVELGSTATPYEPYNGQTIPIDWQTEAGTVYGGKLDVLSGVLTVDRAMVDLGTFTWTYDNTSYDYGFFSSGNIPSKALGSSNIVCSQYKTVHGGRNILTSNATICPYNTSTSSAICVRDDAYTDAATFKSAMSGVQVAYELKTPIEIQLTPHEVKSLYGQNNIFADTGDTEVEYRADTKLYIERLTEPDADMIADANIVSGSYFMVGNILYKATANIASGSAVIEGTNATRKSLSEALNEINA